jgi:hypothetical protein
MSRQSDRALAELFEECLQRLTAGESLSACLARYPEQEALLAPLLQSASAMREYGSVAPRDLTAAAASRARFMAAAQALPRPVTRSSPSGFGGGLVAWWASLTSGLSVLHPVPVALAAFLVCVVIAGVLTTGVVRASAQALPGDSLYSVKLVTEQARLLLTTDQVGRAALAEQFRQTRLQEAASIVRIHRAVPEMQLTGSLESFTPAEWRVAGLPILIDRQTSIVGTPAIGGTVHGIVKAPGDGSLHGVVLQIDSPPVPPQPAAVVTDEGTPVPSATETATATASSTTELPSPAPKATRGPSLMFFSPLPTPPEPSPTLTQPPVLPSPTPSSVVTGTATSTVTASPAVSSTPTRKPTVGPTPRATIESIIRHGYVTAIQGNQWTIAGSTVFTDGDTQFVSQPAVGDLVDAKVQVRDDGSYLALSIVLLVRQLPTPEPFDITGVIEEKNLSVWVIHGNSIQITGQTQISGDPQVGDWVICHSLSYPHGIFALTIEKASLQVKEFSGTIEAIGTDSLTVFGRVVYVDAHTVYTGAPVQVGRIADVSATLLPDGRLLAQQINVRPDTPTPTDTPMAPTSTNSPTFTMTPVPPSSTPSPTSSPVPPSETPSPTFTPVPPTDAPTATETAVPPTSAPAPAKPSRRTESTLTPKVLPGK